LVNNEYQKAVTLLVFSILIGAVATAASAAEHPPIPSFNATYQVRYGLLSGKLTLELGRRDSAYLYATTLRPAGLATWFRRGAITERTTLTVGGGTIRPLEYYGQDTIAKPARHTTYLFDYQGGRVTGQYKTQAIDEPMRPDGQNRISVQIAVMLALRSNSEISNVSVFDRGRWKDYRFEVSGDQAVKTRSGTFDTVEVRYASSDSDRTWSMHFAPELSYLPVMLAYYADGKLKSRAQLTDYRIGTADVSDQEQMNGIAE
jgi:hypothetical protein